MKFAFFFPLEFHVMVIPGHLHEHFFFYIPGLTTHKKFFRKYGLIKPSTETDTNTKCGKS